MANVAFDLNDASLAVARDGNVLLDGPGYAAVAGAALLFGQQARAVIRLHARQASRRHWAGLSDAPLPQPVAGCLTPADLVHGHLAQLWARCEGASGAVLAVMPGWSEAQLGLLLGIAHDVGMPVVGLVDAAVAASRRPYPGRVLWHLQATLGDAWVTRIEQGGGAAALGDRHRVEQAGIESLERGCAEYIARRFVECSRFDPMHAASSEQQLFDRLPDWLAAAARQERVDMTLEHGGNAFTAWLGAAELRNRVARLCEPLLRRMRALASPREPAVVEVHGRLADFPGVIEALALLPACVVVLLEPGAAARGALRVRAAAAPAGGLALTRALPWDRPPEDGHGVVPGVGALPPTHVVFNGRAWRLDGEPVEIGTDIADSAYGIRLDARAQAVSRRHCTIQPEGGRVMVHDQSRYGTLLNGHRIDGSAVLQAGDVLAVGQPLLEFALIAEVARAS
jgi:hypothetical protein